MWLFAKAVFFIKIDKVFFLILSSQNYEEVGILSAYEENEENEVLRPCAEVRGRGGPELSRVSKV